MSQFWGKKLFILVDLLFLLHPTHFCIPPCRPPPPTQLFIIGVTSVIQCVSWNVEGVLWHHGTPLERCQRKEPWRDSLWQTERQEGVWPSLCPPWRQRQVNFLDVNEKSAYACLSQVTFYWTKLHGLNREKKETLWAWQHLYICVLHH